MEGWGGGVEGGGVEGVAVACAYRTAPNRQPAIPRKQYRTVPILNSHAKAFTSMPVTYTRNTRAPVMALLQVELSRPNPEKSLLQPVLGLAVYGLGLGVLQPPYNTLENPITPFCNRLNALAENPNNTL